MRLRMMAVGAAVGLSVAAGVVPAGASTPANQACIGDLFGGFAREFGGPVSGAGGVVSAVATDPGSVGADSFGTAVQALQAGVVPDDVQPNSCNDAL